MSQITTKAGGMACTGINQIEGTIARMAIYKVLEELRPNQTVLSCLPALAAKAEEDVEFVWDYPSIILSGCNRDYTANFTEIDYRAIHTIFNQSCFINQRIGETVLYIGLKDSKMERG